MIVFVVLVVIGAACVAVIGHAFGSGSSVRPRHRPPLNPHAPFPPLVHETNPTDASGDGSHHHDDHHRHHHHHHGQADAAPAAADHHHGGGGFDHGGHGGSHGGGHHGGH
jgi:hypothetical protein